MQGKELPRDEAVLTGCCPLIMTERNFRPGTPAIRNGCAAAHSIGFSHPGYPGMVPFSFASYRPRTSEPQRVPCLCNFHIMHHRREHHRGSGYQRRVSPGQPAEYMGIILPVIMEPLVPFDSYSFAGSYQTTEMEGMINTITIKCFILSVYLFRLGFV